MTTIYNQFDNEPIEHIPRADKEYLCLVNTKATNWTMLMKMTMLTRKHPELIEQLKNYRDDIDKQNSLNMTALMLASTYSNSISTAETVKELVTLGTKIDTADDAGNTPLMSVCINYPTYSKLEVAQLLIDAGADINSKNQKGYTPLMGACVFSRQDTEEKMVKLLIKSKANLNLQNGNGLTALMIACYYLTNTSKHQTVDTLIKAGAELNIQEINGLTALMMSCYCSKGIENQKIIVALIKAGSELQHIKDNMGQCSLDILWRYTEKFYHRPIEVTSYQQLMLSPDTFHQNFTIDHDSLEIYQTIIEHYRHNNKKMQLIFDYLDQKLSNIRLPCYLQSKSDYECYRQCVSLIKSIPEVHSIFYYQPNNIGAIISKNNFERQSNIQQIKTNKSLFLFP